MRRFLLALKQGRELDPEQTFKDYPLSTFRKDLGHRCHVDIGPLLTPYIKDGVSNMKIIELVGNALIYCHKGEGYAGIGDIYSDTQYGFVLAVRSFKKRHRTPEYIFPIAYIGFNPTGNVIIMHQIQSVQYQDNRYNELPYADLLELVRWEKFLIALVESWARENGYTIALIRGAGMNRWAKMPSSNSKHFYMRYDVTARRMGYKRRRRANCTDDENPHYFYLKSLLPPS